MKKIFQISKLKLVSHFFRFFLFVFFKRLITYLLITVIYTGQALMTWKYEHPRRRIKIISLITLDRLGKEDGYHCRGYRCSRKRLRWRQNRQRSGTFFTLGRRDLSSRTERSSSAGFADRYSWYSSDMGPVFGRYRLVEKEVGLL